MNKERKKRGVLDYLFQLVILVLGVYLGILANEWSSEKSNRQHEKDIIAGIRSELSNNLEYLEGRRERRQLFYKSLDSLSKALRGNDEVKRALFYDEPFDKRIPNWPGFGKGVMEGAMFEVAKSGDILPGLKVELLQQLTKTYSDQKANEDYGKTLRQEFFSIDSNTRYFEVIDLMWIFLQEYFGAQYMLIEEYKKSIDLIDKYYKLN